jgi:formylglycine-generating enzyme required for sulfatase activity
VLIGVDDYTEVHKLRFAGNDQRALAEQLIASGFPQDQVFLLHDKATEKKYLPFRENIEKQLAIVLATVSPGDLVIVGFSGHGVQWEGKSYLCPEDTRVDKLPATLIPLDSVYEQMVKCKAALKLLLVDACRSDLLPEGRRSVVLSRSLGEFAAVKESPPQGILLLSSCGPGQSSMEDAAFGHGVFVHYLLEGLRGKAANAEGGVSLAGLYDYASLQTKKYVVRNFNEVQTPAIKGEINGPFEICTVNSKTAPTSPREVSVSLTVHRGEEDGPPVEGADVGLVYMASDHASPLTIGRGRTDAEGKARIEAALSAAQQHGGTFEAVINADGVHKDWPLPEFPTVLAWNVWLPNRPPRPKSPEQPGERTITNSIGMKMVLIPAGEFQMGSSADEIKSWNDWFKQQEDFKSVNIDREGPQHRVRITRPFYLGAYTVTVGQFRKFVEDSGHGAGTSFIDKDKSWRNAFPDQTDQHPVVNVSWDDAVAFCTWLSRKEGNAYRLPTEAEWEYACRAGSATRYCFGNDEEGKELGDYAWYEKNSGSGTHPVGEKRANSFGLYDMHGNVWQWCADWCDRDYYAASPTDDPTGPSTGSSRVLRGGSWNYPARHCRSAYRCGYGPGARINRLGFRVARAAEFPVTPASTLRVPNRPPPLKSPEQPPESTLTNSIGMKMVLIPAGEFQMGSGETNEQLANAFHCMPRFFMAEHPQHRVRITKPFYMGQYPVTLGEFLTFYRDADYKLEMERDGKEDFGTLDNGEVGKSANFRPWAPGGWKPGMDEPVVWVTWNDAVAFCQWLSKKEGKEYRLPTEAQWEYACRAGSTTRYYFGDDESTLGEYAWYAKNSAGRTHPVGEKKPNAWGLYDMQGSVRQWCADWYDKDFYEKSPNDDPRGPHTGSDRAYRGGGSIAPAQQCQSAYRYGRSPAFRRTDVGFRVARSAE